MRKDLSASELEGFAVAETRGCLFDESKLIAHEFVIPGELTRLVATTFTVLPLAFPIFIGG